LLVTAALALEVRTGLMSAYIGDVITIGHLNAGGIAMHLRGAFWSNTLILLVGFGVVAGLAREPLSAASGLPWESSGAALRSIKVPALAAACLALTLWTESQSTGGAGLVALSALAFAPSLAGGRFGRVNVALAAGVVLLTAGLFADQVLRRGWCLLEQAPEYRAHPALSALAPGLRVTPGRLGAAELTARLWRDHRPVADEAYRSGFDFHLESYGAPVSFVANALLAHEAAERLRALGLDRGLKHAMTLSFVDDFSPLLGLPPAPGTKLALDPYRTIAPPTKAEAAAYLAPIDAAFERTCAAPLHARQIADFFRPALEEAFAPVVLTPCWTVHLRAGQTR
jgi:hypothetical protein